MLFDFPGRDQLSEYLTPSASNDIPVRRRWIVDLIPSRSAFPFSILSSVDRPRHEALLGKSFRDFKPAQQTSSHFDSLKLQRVLPTRGEYALEAILQIRPKRREAGRVACGAPQLQPCATHTGVTKRY